ncbi:hypothetical protein LEP1GSC170_5149 [Leptospira interrogans serovar Bataviae str. HAI135]|uniref:Uncharacterized protein n=1 Tax=Leptospira noguchii str. 2007001578 TaxID=1049974 RepID=A0ABP2T8C7_9LEPT|nr:hypothetical protein LEP1GSC035_3081 [Leptospira noguchii str. 2007001578]EMO25973.1 hypothetical protein LEP1GSC170_5149 [Leptospira interrogans serovar Bataviae str. HAI135]
MKNTGRELGEKSLNLPNSKKGRICKSKSKSVGFFVFFICPRTVLQNDDLLASQTNWGFSKVKFVFLVLDSGF